MATKSIFLPVVKLSLLIFLFSGCQNLGLKTRKQIEKETPQTSDQPINPATGSGELTTNQPNIEKPQFLQKEAPKLGIILSPGGALSFAQIGFLQALEEQKIPVYGIAGIEWGALVAAAYAMDKKAHSIEWKLLKLPGSKFEPSGGLFTSSSQPQVGDFSAYLDKVFGKARLDETAIPFACSAIDVNSEKSSVYTRGSTIGVMKSCWPSSPHFKLSRVGADYTGVKALADYLRNQGANLVVYVDVMDRNTLLSDSIRNKNKEMAWALLQTKKLSSQLSSGVVDKVVHLPVSGQTVNSYKGLRSIIRKGQIKSKSIVKDMAKQYAY